MNAWAGISIDTDNKSVSEIGCQRALTLATFMRNGTFMDVTSCTVVSFLNNRIVSFRSALSPFTPFTTF